MKYVYGILIFISFIFYACNDSSVNQLAAITSETWHLIEDGNIHDSVNLTLYKMEDSSLSVSGNWVYVDYWDDVITCPMMSGYAVREDSSLLITTTGTAYFPPDSLGIVDTSPFTLTVKGVFINSQSRGSWSIEMTSDYGIDSLSGYFTGTRISSVGAAFGM
jgi:hypothetical protein